VAPAGLGSFAPALAPHSPRIAAAHRIALRLPGAHGVAVTFDDGPHPEGTPAMLDELRRGGARATFFVVGENVRRWPELARQIVAEGHEVALHGDRHTLLLRRSRRAVQADFDRAVDTVREATAGDPVVYRPPYGVFSSGALAEVRSRGWRPVLWSTWGRDWTRRATPESIAWRATRRLRPGDVMLLHDSDAYSSQGSWRRTAAALPSVLDAIEALGVPAVSISQST
jgi:peptidoglycan-N-acetylglucosamine deacetylase